MVMVWPSWSRRENSGAGGVSVKTPPARPLAAARWRRKKTPPAMAIRTTTPAATAIQAAGSFEAGLSWVLVFEPYQRVIGLAVARALSLIT